VCCSCFSRLYCSGTLLFLCCCCCTCILYLVLVPGLTWGDRRAGRRPQSARNSSREAVRILRDRTFRDRRVRHSTRLIRLRQTDSDPADCTITICPAIVPPSFAVGASARARGRDQKKGEAHTGRRRPRHRGISSSSSWK
jgi:hypothetical protein